MCHSDSRLPAAGVAILTNILDSQIHGQIVVSVLWNFWRKMELKCIHDSRQFQARDFFALKIEENER